MTLKSVNFVSRSILACCILAASVGGSGCKKEVPAENLTYNSFVKSLCEISSLAESRTGQRHLHTSYDRSGGNDDYGYFSETLSDGRKVIADFEGPGCVHRFWFTGIRNDKKISFYFDDETEPRLTITPLDISGESKLFPTPVAQMLSGAHYSYVPMPFQKRLRVVTDIKPGDRYYYQFTYSTYAPGSTVPQFKPGDESLLAAVEDIRAAWAAEEGPAGGGSADWAGTIAPGQSVAMFEDNTEGSVQSFWLKPDFGQNWTMQERNSALRTVVLKIYWDGKSFPSVNVPLGDYFCNPWRKKNFSSAPLACVDGTYVSRYPMPYRKGAKIELVNEGGKPITVSAGFERGATGEAKQMYFHANWLYTSPAQRPHLILNTKGRGHFVGCFLAVTGVEKSWMILEGDDQIFIDGEKQSSMHGTGLEDYFNGGWYYNNLFSRPQHGLTERSPFRTAQYRFHVPDPVDFSKGFHMQFEKGSQNSAAGHMTSVAYWYQDKPAEAAELPSAAARSADADPLEAYTFMVNQLEAERVGEYEEAMDLCREFAEKHPGTLEAAIAVLRSVAYREKLQGFKAVESTYVQYSKHPNRVLADTAGMLLAHNRNPDTALVGIHTAGSFEFFVDGKPVGTGKGPTEMKVFPVKLAPGEHVFAVKAPYERHESWLSLYMKSKTTNHFTDVSWKVTYESAPGWEQPGFDDSGWKQASLKGRIPFLGYFYFTPNAFVDMQSPWHNIRPRDWNAVKRTAYFRKRITIPSPGK